MTATGFVHLLVHTEYSITDSLVRIGDLARRTAQMSMPAVAMTDRCALFGLVKFYDACLSAGVKPIVGVDFHYRHAGDVNRCVLLAASNEGYANLLRLVSRAYVDTGGPVGRETGPEAGPETARRGRREHGLLDRQWILSAPEGLIALSGGCQGDVGRALLADDMPGAARLADEWRRAFGDRYYIEVRRTERAGEDDYVRSAVDLCSARSLPVVATNDVCFLQPDEFEAHETRVCIQQGRTLDDPRRERGYSEAQYLRSAEEMAALFDDLPEALENTVEIAKRCNLELNLGAYHPPNYPTSGRESLEAFLRRSATEGLEARLRSRAGGASGIDAGTYAERLDHELGIIEETGFAGYFLVVAEFVNWARRNGVPVGPGRGSGSGSLVAYALNVTNVDPLEYDLIFERFLNPERKSLPDIDIDFCMEGRDSVIRHVSERYGADAVSQIATFGTMAAKAVVRDVARAQGKPYGLADRLSKMIPAEVGMTLATAVAREQELQRFIDENADAAEIVEMAYRLEGIVRNVGKHAGGVVIAPGPLTEFVPLYADDRSGGAISQFDKDDVERAGLVKFDFLGLRTLTIIDWAVKAVNAGREEGYREEGNREEGVNALDIDAIPLDDEATYALLRSGETTAVFQLESRGMKELLRRLAPDRIDEVIALVALYRPGPLQSGTADDFIDRKHRRKPVEYEDPKLEDGLKETYGVLLYQEQVMYAARVLAGFSQGQADVLRAAMGKKKPEEMVRVREQFMSGALSQGVPEPRAAHIFDQMEKFSGYAFPKGHATTYGIVTYQTAWLKCHYPAEFMAAVLSADMQDADKMVALVNELRRMDLALRPPHINTSQFRFSVIGGGILYGLGAVRGVGAGAVAAIVEQRASGGPFKDLFDLCSRVQGSDAGRNAKNVIEPLICAGALDCFAVEGEDVDHLRARLMEELPTALARAEQGARDAAMGISDMFGDVVAEEPAVPSDTASWTRSERLAAEKKSLGLYLTGHPIDAYLDEIATLRSTPIDSLVQGRSTQTVAGLVVSVRSRRSRRGDSMAFVGLDDRTGRIEATVSDKVLAAARDKLVNDAVLVVEAEVEYDDYAGSLRLRARSVETLEEARVRLAECLKISVDGNGTDDEFALRLRDLLQSHRLGEAADGCPVAVEYCCDKARVRVDLGERWRVVPSNALVEELGAAFGAERVEFAYPGQG